MSEGIRLTELKDLPPAQRIVLQAVMRRALTYDALLQTVSDSTSEVSLTAAELDRTIAGLIERGWLVHEDDHYRANIARKPGKRLSKRIWDALDDVEADEKTERTAADDDNNDQIRRGGNRRLPGSIWENLDKPDETPRPARRQKLSAGLWDTLSDEKPPPESTDAPDANTTPAPPADTTDNEPPPARPRRQRKSLFDAFDDEEARD